MLLGMADRHVHPNVVLKSYWTASWSDSPEPLSGRPIEARSGRLPAEAPEHCARCGAGGLQPHDASDDSGTAWRQLFFQFHCESCGAYTLFHYDD